MQALRLRASGMTGSDAAFIAPTRLTREEQESPSKVAAAETARLLKEYGLTTKPHHTTASTIPDQVSVPVRHVLVGHSGGHVEHNDSTLALKMDMWLMVD